MPVKSGLPGCDITFAGRRSAGEMPLVFKLSIRKNFLELCGVKQRMMRDAACSFGVAPRAIGLSMEDTAVCMNPDRCQSVVATDARLNSIVCRPLAA